MVSALPDDTLTTIRTEAQALGFRAIGVGDIQLADEARKLTAWLAAGCHGDMHYMAKNQMLRAKPQALVPGAVRVISALMDYYPPDAYPPEQVLNNAEQGYISRYALARDYHKIMRHRLKKLAQTLAHILSPHRFRVFSDSAPVMEVALAARSGLGWRGKHTLLLTRKGSYFFLGEIFTDLPLPLTEATMAHCGNCRACLDACPTQAIIAPYRLDARRCISYLTIEHFGSIDETLRPFLGNRIYGCDDCQLACPWNRFAQSTPLAELAQIRHQFDHPDLATLFCWDETTFLRNCEGSAIRRIGHVRWLRNIATALGNALRKPNANHAALDAALNMRLHHPHEIVREHVRWALQQRHNK